MALQEKRYINKDTYLVRIRNYLDEGFEFLLGKAGKGGETRIWDTRKVRPEELLAAISWYMNESGDQKISAKFNFMSVDQSIPLDLTPTRYNLNYWKYRKAIK